MRAIQNFELQSTIAPPVRVSFRLSVVENDDCRLCAEQVPPKALFSHDGGQAAEKLSDRSAT